jgi:hypothetical protein
MLWCGPCCACTRIVMLLRPGLCQLVWFEHGYLLTKPVTYTLHIRYIYIDTLSMGTCSRSPLHIRYIYVTYIYRHLEHGYLLTKPASDVGTNADCTRGAVPRSLASSLWRLQNRVPIKIIVSQGRAAELGAFWL